MQVGIIRGSEDPEQLVCEAARNDYRNDGIVGHDFEEVMDSIEPDESHLPDNGMSDPGSILEAKKRTLIDDLIDSGHWGPFEHPQATIAIEGVTRVVTHQIVRHRQFTYDQQSLRYVEVDGDPEDGFQIPEGAETGEFVSRDGVSEVPPTDGIFRDAYERAMEDYKTLIDKGVPQEEARKVLPMGVKTNIVMSGNARAWMHILNVRTKADVQGETRDAAEAIFEELKSWMPYTFTKYDEDVLPLKLNP